MIDFTNVTELKLGNAQVERVTDSLGAVLWEVSHPEPVPTNGYFYIEDASGSDNTLTVQRYSNNAPVIEVFKSTDQVNWVSMGTTDTNITTTIPANSKVYFKSVTNRLSSTNIEAGNRFRLNRAYNVGGNITSLLFGDNFENTSVTNNNSLAFEYFFDGQPIVDASNLILPDYVPNRFCLNMFRECTSLTTAPVLPATTLAESCYIGMFADCTSLTTAPALPATTLASECYRSMFSGCRALTTAPALPATTLASNCYNGMFWGCTSLTTAPALPATTLVNRCYIDMFHDCTSLTTAPALPATNSDTGCYWSMFYGCTSLTTAPTINLTNLSSHSCDSMFHDCTSLTTAPALPVTTLADGCYWSMFNGCTNLNSVTTYAQDISATNCLSSWLDGVSASGDFYNLGGATYPSGANGIPTGWTEHRANCNVSISAGNNGSVSVNGVSGDYSQSVAYNTQLTLVATPDSGYAFGSWSDGDTNATRTITVTNDLTLTTSFYLNVNYNVSISAGSNGSVSVNGVTGDYSQSVLNGTQLTLVATPDNGYIFDEWSDGDTNATRTITVTNDLTLTAAFEVYTGVPDYHIQYTTTDNNQLSLSNSVITNHTFTNGVGDITINTTTLPAKFFENKTTLRTLAYGGNIEFAAGGYQHSGCENLESVDLPANMTYIPQRWFRTCRKLSRLDLPVSAMTWNISWPFYYTATQTTEGVLHVYVHNSTTLPTMDYTKYGTPKDNCFYVTGNNGSYDGTNIENLIRLHVPSSLYNDYITTAPHSSVASCISSY